LRQHAHAAIDVSDGLVGDLGKLCLASGVGAELEVARVPLSGPAEVARGAEPTLLATMLTGGDDFEIACAVPMQRLDEFATAADEAKVPVTAVGRVVAGKGVRVIGPDGKPMQFKRTSFSHF
jgi:thiamine-monophosphate kinase